MDAKNSLLLLLILLLTLAVLLADLATQLGVATGVLYITVVLLAVYLPRPGLILVFAALCTLLVVAGYFLAPEGGEPWKVLANRFISIFAIWITAVLLRRRRQSEEGREKAIRDLESANRNLQSFSYAVSHDLRNPLLTIEGLANRLLKHHEAEPADQDGKLLREIGNSCGRAQRLIDDILDFSRATTGEIKKSAIDMKALAAAVFEELRPATGERRIDLTIEPLPAAHGDPAMIHQVLVNYLTNALKFTATRENAEIRVGGYARRHENVYYVKDNGVGFDMQAATERLFHLFQRLHPAHSFAGTGIGLVIVKTIVEKHGGRVWAESKPEQGATFYFALPKDRRQ